MGLVDKFKSWAYPDSDVDNEEIEADEVDFMKPRNTYFDDVTTSSHSEKRNKVVNIHATTQLRVVLAKPERYSEVQSIADNLNKRNTVVLNLESAQKNDARRILDFLSGVAYANSGTIKKIANNTFIITPYNVDIMGDMLLDELEGNGYSF